MRRPTVLLLSLALLAHTPGCLKKKVKKALETETRASLTVRGDAQVLDALTREVGRLHKVDATLETVETGVRILRIVGAYAAVVDAMVWMLKQGLGLLANDEVSEALLQIAIAAMK